MTKRQYKIEEPWGYVTRPAHYTTLRAAENDLKEILEILSEIAGEEQWPNHHEMELAGIYTCHKKPNDIDDDGYSPSLGLHWLNSDWDYICCYRIVKVE